MDDDTSATAFTQEGKAMKDYWNQIKQLPVETPVAGYEGGAMLIFTGDATLRLVGSPSKLLLELAESAQRHGLTVEHG